MNSEIQKRFDSVLSRSVESGQVPGVAAVVVDRQGTVYEGACGVRALGKPEPMAIDSVVWIASMTKAVTAAAAMQLVECGLLNLHSPAADVLPEIAGLGVLEGFEANGKPQVRPPKRPVTLHHLMTHTSGFCVESAHPELMRYRASQGLPALFSTFLNDSLLLPMLYDPGEHWEYGLGLEWTGRMIEAVTGKTLGVYLQENVFEPLGMRYSGFNITPAMRQRLAKCHVRAGCGWMQELFGAQISMKGHEALVGDELMPVDFELMPDKQLEAGGSALYSTAEDFANFVGMILNRGMWKGKRLLKSETVEQMSHNNIGEIPMILKVPDHIREAMPYLVDEFYPGVTTKWGLSFQLNQQTTHTGMAPGSMFWGGMANTFFWIDPAAGLAGVYITQVLPTDKRCIGPFYEFQSAVYQSFGVKAKAHAG